MQIVQNDVDRNFWKNTERRLLPVDQGCSIAGASSGREAAEQGALQHWQQPVAIRWIARFDHNVED